MNMKGDQETAKDFVSLTACLSFFLCCKLCSTVSEQTKIYLILINSNMPSGLVSSMICMT